MITLDEAYAESARLMSKTDQLIASIKPPPLWFWELPPQPLTLPDISRMFDERFFGKNVKIGTQLRIRLPNDYLITPPPKKTWLARVWADLLAAAA